MEKLQLERMSAEKAHPEFYPELLPLDNEIDEAVHYSWEGAREMERQEAEWAE